MDKRKIFISWSGEKSQAVALALYDFLPTVLEHYDPWMSPVDIPKGVKWRDVVRKNLEEAFIGVLCLTSENLNRPWILFEAGALDLSQKQPLVIPYLIDVGARDMHGPLDTFNSALANKEETEKMVKDINKRLGEYALQDYKISVLFSTSWPRLENVLKEVTSGPKKGVHDHSWAPIRAEMETLRLSKPRSERAKRDQKKSRELEDRHMKRYGFKARRSTMRLEIIDLDGTCRLMRRVEGIKVNRGHKLESLPGAHLLVNPSSRFIRYPRLNKSGSRVKSPSLVFQKKESNECIFQIKFEGGLTAKNREAAFGYESKVSRALLMTREEVEEAYKDDLFKKEYYSAEVDTPLDELVVQVQFPRGFDVEPRPGVFSPRGEVLDEIELRRISSGFERNNNTAELLVKDPLVEYTYLIYWLPPLAKDLSRRRAVRGNIESKRMKGGEARANLSKNKTRHNEGN
jgi:hypothetical protein